MFMSYVTRTVSEDMISEKENQRDLMVVIEV